MQLLVQLVHSELDNLSTSAGCGGAESPAAAAASAYAQGFLPSQRQLLAADRRIVLDAMDSLGGEGQASNCTVAKGCSAGCDSCTALRSLAPDSSILPARFHKL